MGNPLLDAVSYLGESLDKPGRAVRGLLGGNPREALNLVPFSDALGLTDPAERVSGKQLLGLGEDDGLLGSLAGAGAEMALDPLNLVGGLAVRKLLGLRKAAAESNAVREMLLAKGAMPEEVAAATKAVDAAGKPLKLFHGTGAAFDAYDMGKMNPESLVGRGVYLTDNPEVASSYADVRADQLFNKRGAAESGVRGARRSLDNELERLAAGKSQEKYVDSFRRQLADREAELAAVPEPRPNVRPHFLDTRAPIDLGVPSGGPKDVASWAPQHGADALRYEGGHLAGGGETPHQVYVALDPSQLYAPLVAPGVKGVPRASPLLGALGLENVLARGAE